MKDASETEYCHISSPAGEPPNPDDGGLSDRHFHPAHPRTIRGVQTMTF